MQSPLKDLATGKNKVYVYLDPNQIVDKQNYDHDWRDLHLYMPGVLVESGEDEVKVRMTASGDIVRVKNDGLLHVEAQDKMGVPDIMGLDNFSEQSLLHTIRLRFERVQYREALLYLFYLYYDSSLPYSPHCNRRESFCPSNVLLTVLV